MSDYEIVALGDACLSVEYENVIDPQINARCLAMAEWLEQQHFGGVRDIVPAFRSVAVHYDPLIANREQLQHVITRGAAASLPARNISTEADVPLEVPVRYGGDDGPDLPSVAAFARCTEADVVRIHSSVVYRVYMLGFLPGFPYMATVDSRIAMPRLDTPRLKVAAGSVAIAGNQTGIYPFDSPGGWRIIGRTSLQAYVSSRDKPFLFRPGQAVKFVAE